MIFEYVCGSAENATMGEDLHFDCLRFDFWEGRKQCILVSKISPRIDERNGLALVSELFRQSDSLETRRHCVFRINNSNLRD